MSRAGESPLNLVTCIVVQCYYSYVTRISPLTLRVLLKLPPDDFSR